MMLLARTNHAAGVAKNMAFIARNSGPVAKGFSVDVKLHALGDGALYLSCNWYPFPPNAPEIGDFGKKLYAVVAPVFEAALESQLKIKSADMATSAPAERHTA